MKEKTFILTNDYGLDFPKARLFVETANLFKSALKISTEGQDTEANGKSDMGLMLLAADRGSKLTIKATGPDEASAISALGQLIAQWGQRDEDHRQRSIESSAWSHPPQPYDFSRDTSRSASLEPSGTYLLDPSPWQAPPSRNLAAEWKIRLSALHGANIAVNDLEGLLEKFVKRPLQKVAHPDERTMLMSACATIFDFPQPVDEWIKALEASKGLRKSKRGREKLLKDLLNDSLKFRLAAQPAPSSRSPKRLPAPAPKRYPKRKAKRSPRDKTGRRS